MVLPIQSPELRLLVLVVEVAAEEITAALWDQAVLAVVELLE
jgi:hypothetical protein